MDVEMPLQVFKFFPYFAWKWNCWIFTFYVPFISHQDSAFQFVVHLILHCSCRTCKTEKRYFQSFRFVRKDESISLEVRHVECAHFFGYLLKSVHFFFDIFYCISNSSDLFGIVIGNFHIEFIFQFHN